MKRGNMQQNIRQRIIDIDQQHQDGFNEELSDDGIQDSQHDLGPVASSESKWNMFVTDENKGWHFVTGERVKAAIFGNSDTQ